ncbi:hypothetical protein BGY98DRAFT_995135 [Russula aff. rugulosa BPL654]|nr:hypothetical protein BGY98DRAFT_995135 [Russula aff. rugulosa BPL654]
MSQGVDIQLKILQIPLPHHQLCTIHGRLLANVLHESRTAVVPSTAAVIPRQLVMFVVSKGRRGRLLHSAPQGV